MWSNCLFVILFLPTCFFLPFCLECNFMVPVVWSLSLLPLTAVCSLAAFILLLPLCQVVFVLPCRETSRGAELLGSKANSRKKKLACGQCFGLSHGSALSPKKDGLIPANSGLCELFWLTNPSEEKSLVLFRVMDRWGVLKVAQVRGMRNRRGKEVKLSPIQAARLAGVPCLIFWSCCPFEWGTVLSLVKAQ